MLSPLTGPVRIGTDCSGMETPVMALKKLKVPFEHMFSCDVDKNVKKQLLHNFPATEWFDDLMARDNTASSTPGTDLYVAGFPCQSFSSCGLGKGFKDKRGKVFFGCCDYIESQRPRAFVLENVKKILAHEKGKTFQKVLKYLNLIGDGAYEVHYKLLNTREHGVPQSRPRVYIVGIRKDCKVCEFEYPQPLQEVSIACCLDSVKKKPTFSALPRASSATAFNNARNILKRLSEQGAAPLSNTYVLDIDATAAWATVSKDRSPCMIKSRAAGYWLTSHGRRMNIDEMLRCQGMERCFEQVVNDRALGGQIGNAMSQNILERLFISLLPAAGLVPHGTVLKDRWVHIAKTAAPYNGPVKAPLGKASKKRGMATKRPSPSSSPSSSPARKRLRTLGENSKMA